MKFIKKIFPIIISVCILTGISISASAAIANPLVTEDLEKATGNFIITRDTDKVADTMGGTIFAFPYAGGDKLLKIADKSNPATAQYVIEGNKSVYFMNVGDNATADQLPLITKGALKGTLDFVPDKIYVARFLMKVISPFAKGASLTVTVRTWSWSDPWVDFNITPDAENGIIGKVARNGRIYDKIAIKRVGDDLYEVAIRFQGVANTTSCYLSWYLLQQAGISIDGFKLYESNASPDKAFEYVVAGSSSPSTSSIKTSSVNNNKSSSTSKASGSSNINSNTSIVSSVESSNASALSDSAVSNASNDSSTVDTQSTNSLDASSGSVSNSPGLNAGAIILIILAVLIVGGGSTAVILIRKKKV